MGVGGGWTVGVDLGGTFVKLALLDPDGAIVARERMPTEGAAGHETVLARMAEAVRRLVGQAPAGSVVGVGLGVPGMADVATGVVAGLTNLPGHWHGVPAGPILAEATELPVRVINDARAFAVAESRLGAARGADTALCVTVGTGIGGGSIAFGRVLFGLGGNAGEIGHLIVHPGGLRCGCGNRGCVEPYATGPAIAAEGVRRVLQGFQTSLLDVAGGDLAAITPEVVDQAAEAGDEVAIEVLTDAGRWLGLGLAGVIATVAPEVVVIGGGVARPGGTYWRSAEATARANVHVVEVEQIAFRPAALGYDAGVIGAALWGRGAQQDAVGAP